MNIKYIGFAARPRHLLSALLLAFLAGCSIRVDTITTTRSSSETVFEPVGHTVRIKQEPRGLTGCIEFELCTVENRYDITQEYDVFTEKRLKLWKFYLAGGTSAALAAVIPVFGVMGAAISFPAAASDPEYEYNRIGEQKRGRPKRLSRGTRLAPLADSSVTIRVPQADLVGVLETNDQGVAAFHLLEPVMATKGQTDLTIQVLVNGAVEKEYRLAQDEAVRMLATYRDALREQAEVLYREILALQHTQERLLHERATLATENLALEEEVLALQRRNEQLGLHIAQLERQHSAELARRNDEREKATLAALRAGKLGWDTYNSGRFAYKNYRLVKTGMTISRAFRLTLPTFLAGWIAEELVWAVIEETLEP